MFRKPIVLVACAVALGGLLGGAGFVLSGVLDDDSEDAIKTAVGSADGLESFAEDAKRAADLAGVRKIGQSAEDVATELESSADAVEEDENQEGALLGEILQRELAIVEPMIELQELNRGSLGSAATAVGAASRSVSHLGSLRQEAVELELDPGVVATETVMASGVEALKDLISRAQRVLARWKREYRAQRREQQVDLATLRGYRQSMDGLTARYGSARSELQTWLDGVDTGDGVTFAAAYRFLSNARAKREEVRAGIAALDAPAPLASAHNQLVAVMDQAIAAISSAEEGTSDFQFDFRGKYRSYRETPGWTEFSASSDEISASYSAAEADWQSAIEAEEESIGDRSLPKPPRL